MFIEYKNGEKHAGASAERSESMEAFRDCGMLLADDDVVIDIDHLPQNNIRDMIVTFGLVTRTVWTDRGAHLWFKRPAWMTRRRDGVCRLGFVIEQHTKGSNPNGMTVKRNGIPRKIDNMDTQMYLPSIFKVDGKNAFNDLTGMDEGDGRNKALFAHRQGLMKVGAPDQEKIISFINRSVFAIPLPDNEMENLTRDMVSTESEEEETVISNTIIRECRTVVYSGLIWWYQNGKYICDETNKYLTRRVYEACEGKKTRFVDEVMKQIEYRSPLIPPDTVFPIRFRNGILRNGSFIKIQEYHEFTPYFIDIDYIPNAKPVEMVDQYIENLTSGDPDYKKLLMEVIGYVLITDPEQIRALGKFFMFRGDGQNGKGTMLQIMKKIYNAKNCTNLSIKQLVDDRFKVTMIGKLANLGDDIEAEAIDNDQLKVLKNISTADTVSTRKLYAQSESATFTVKLYFTTNSDIRSFEKGYAYKRRILWMPMFNKIEKVDSRFITKITSKEALEYWVSMIVEGYMRLYHNMEWTECKLVQDYNEQYHEENDICHQFAKDLDPDTEIIGKTITEMKAAFLEWDTEDRKFSNKFFKAAVWDLYQIGIGKGKVGGQSKRVFMRQTDTDQRLIH